jgi:hypothetical protein
MCEGPKVISGVGLLRTRRRAPRAYIRRGNPSYLHDLNNILAQRSLADVLSPLIFTNTSVKPLKGEKKKA